jgi:hypothetical protein
MDANFLQEITKVLTEFAATKFTAQVLEVKGPVLEGSNYRWRMISNRFREVTVVLATKKPFFGKSTPVGFEVHGLGDTKSLPPDVNELQKFLGQAELTAVGDL